MLEKLLLWLAVFLLVLVVSVSHWEIAWAMVLITASAALALGELYSQYKADKEYRRDLEAALLIGRYSMGIDHKGRRTGKIIR